MAGGFLNRWTHSLWIAGVEYGPGTVIPATVDPAQLAYFAAQGIVEPSTAPASIPPLRRVSSTTQDAGRKEVTDGDDRPE